MLYVVLYIHILGKEAAYKERFTNTKRGRARYFQNSSKFAATYTKKLLNKAAKDGASNKPVKNRSRTFI